MTDYDAVDALAAVLCDRALTAAAIADIFNCSKQVAYKRLQTLRDRGVKLTAESVRQGRTGPEAVAYGRRRR